MPDLPLHRCERVRVRLLLGRRRAVEVEGGRVKAADRLRELADQLDLLVGPGDGGVLRLFALRLDMEPAAALVEHAEEVAASAMLAGEKVKKSEIGGDAPRLVALYAEAAIVLRTFANEARSLRAGGA